MRSGYSSRTLEIKSVPRFKFANKVSPGQNSENILKILLSAKGSASIPITSNAYDVMQYCFKNQHRFRTTSPMLLFNNDSGRSQIQATHACTSASTKGMAQLKALQAILTKERYTDPQSKPNLWAGDTAQSQ